MSGEEEQKSGIWLPCEISVSPMVCIEERVNETYKLGRKESLRLIVEELGCVRATW